MTNPYEASATATPAMQAPLSKAALIVGLICSVLAAAVPTLVLPQFRQAFESFGAELPLVTRLLLKYHFVMWAAPVAVMAAWRYWPNCKTPPLGRLPARRWRTGGRRACHLHRTVFSNFQAGGRNPVIGHVQETCNATN